MKKIIFTFLALFFSIFFISTNQVRAANVCTITLTPNTVATNGTVHIKITAQTTANFAISWKGQNGAGLGWTAGDYHLNNGQAWDYDLSLSGKDSINNSGGVIISGYTTQGSLIAGECTGTVTISNLCAAPYIPVSGQCSYATSSSVTFNWTPNPPTSSALYMINFCPLPLTSAGFNGVGCQMLAVNTATSYTATGLTPGTNYIYRVLKHQDDINKCTIESPWSGGTGLCSTLTTSGNPIPTSNPGGGCTPGTSNNNCCPPAGYPSYNYYCPYHSPDVQDCFNPTTCPNGITCDTSGVHCNPPPSLPTPTSPPTSSSPPTATITGPSTLTPGQTGQYQITANDQNGLSSGQFFWSPSSTPYNWTPIPATPVAMSGLNWTYSVGWTAPSTPGTYWLVVNANNSMGGHCTGNPTTPSNDTDCGTSSRIQVTVGSTSTGNGADINRDGKVDLVDFNLWLRAKKGTDSSQSDGSYKTSLGYVYYPNADGNNSVDAGDFTFWLNYFKSH